MRLIYAVLASCLLNTTAFAESDIEIKGKIKQIIPDNTPHSSIHYFPQKPSSHTVTLLKVKLSEKAWNKLSERVEHNSQEPAPPLPPHLKGLATETQLGMDNVPVMDQGAHGTCATFATTAAVDAALEAGDYISQVCTLQLGQYLEHFGYNPSGWDGSLNTLVLDQLRAFGFVNKTTQREEGCGGVTEYPVSGEVPEGELSLERHYEISEPLSERNFAWSSVLDIHQVFLDRTDPQKTLETVKQALRNHDRLTFGGLLFRLNEGTAGALGKHNQRNDTWVLTPEILDDIMKHRNYGGHAMVITGFDDYATAVDKNNRVHRGLLTLRNSWGESAGDGGDFYMSYDYFKLLAFEINRVRSLKRFTE